jgi:CHAD domain-containing protein
LRLAAKHARYATETLAPLLQLDPRLKLRMLKRLQDCLGEHRDAGEALHWLDRLGEPFGPVLKSRLAGPIAKVQARHMRELDRLACRFEMPRL